MENETKQTIPHGMHWSVDSEKNQILVFDNANECFSVGNSLHDALVEAHCKRLISIIHGEFFIEKDKDGKRFMISNTGAWEF